MYEVIYTGQFRRSLKLCVRRGLKISDFKKVLDILHSLILAEDELTADSSA